MHAAISSLPLILYSLTVKGMSQYLNIFPWLSTRRLTADDGMTKSHLFGTASCSALASWLQTLNKKVQVGLTLYKQYVSHLRDTFIQIVLMNSVKNINKFYWLILFFASFSTIAISEQRCFLSLFKCRNK